MKLRILRRCSRRHHYMPKPIKVRSPTPVHNPLTEGSRHLRVCSASAGSTPNLARVTISLECEFVGGIRPIRHRVDSLRTGADSQGVCCPGLLRRTPPPARACHLTGADSRRRVLPRSTQSSFVSRPPSLGCRPRPSNRARACVCTFVSPFHSLKY